MAAFSISQMRRWNFSFEILRLFHKDFVKSFYRERIENISWKSSESQTFWISRTDNWSGNLMKAQLVISGWVHKKQVFRWQTNFHLIFLFVRGFFLELLDHPFRPTLINFPRIFLKRIEMLPKHWTDKAFINTWPLNTLVITKRSEYYSVASQ